MWTQFMDMHSGGSLKHGVQYIYIEAPKEEAKSVFYSRFGTNPERVTCTCCGGDYSITESETLEQASAFERGCKHDKESRSFMELPEKDSFRWQAYQTIEEYLKHGDIQVIYAKDITDEERETYVPEEGYVWM